MSEGGTTQRVVFSSKVFLVALCAALRLAKSLCGDSEIIFSGVFFPTGFG